MMLKTLSLSVVLGLALNVMPVEAQQAPSLLTLEQERVLSDSKAGQVILAEEARVRAELQSQGRQLDAELEAEELRLTGLRATTDPVEFRKLADEFDARVVSTRKEQEEKAAEAQANSEQARRLFFARVAPVLQAILQETGAGAVVEQRLVLISNQNLNITDEVIRRLDRDTQTDPSPTQDEKN